MHMRQRLLLKSYFSKSLFLNISEAHHNKTLAFCDQNLKARPFCEDLFVYST